MKIKLLKIVRKRYTITKVEEFGLKPFFRIKDRYDSWVSWNLDTYERAFEKLMSVIHIEYLDRSKGKRKTKTTKIWYK